MIEKTIEQTEGEKTQATAVETDNGVKGKEVSLGKFNDVNALLSAYNSLQAEFTKRCQRIKELEAMAVADKTEVPAVTQIDGKERADEIVKDYLINLIGAKANAVVLGDIGKAVKTPVSAPKTIREAGNLAKELLAKK